MGKNGWWSEHRRGSLLSFDPTAVNKNISATITTSSALTIPPPLIMAPH
jgi:hypothetical protein